MTEQLWMDILDCTEIPNKVGIRTYRSQNKHGTLSKSYYYGNDFNSL